MTVFYFGSVLFIRLCSTIMTVSTIWGLGSNGITVFASAHSLTQPSVECNLSENERGEARQHCQKECVSLCVDFSILWKCEMKSVASFYFVFVFHSHSHSAAKLILFTVFISFNVPYDFPLLARLVNESNFFTLRLVFFFFFCISRVWWNKTTKKHQTHFQIENKLQFFFLFCIFFLYPIRIQMKWSMKNRTFFFSNFVIFHSKIVMFSFFVHC